MAKKSSSKASAPAPAAHHEAMGNAVFQGMRHLATSGAQTINAEVNPTFAELQDEGPTARDPLAYPAKKAGT